MNKNTPLTPDEYVNQLPDDRKNIINHLRETIKKNLPEGFIETISYGTIGYVVPHSVYPKGYHCNPKEPLPFINISSQKNHISLHHLGLYADKNLMEWFEEEYKKVSAIKLDMGKGCVRFKKAEHIPYELIGRLVSKISVQDWIGKYESAFRKEK
ncbi:MAG: DUF1801 domain-containing protein [Bacteroidia bacterium]